MNSPRLGYVYDTNEQGMTILQCLDVTLQNPAGSGKKIIVEGYSFINQGNVMMTAKLIHMPTGNLPTTALKPMPYLVDTDISNPDNVGIFKYTVKLIASKMTGGTNIITLPIKAGDRNYVESTPLTLLPGVTIGLSINPGIVVTGLTVAIYTREENI